MYDYTYMQSDCQKQDMAKLCKNELCTTLNWEDNTGESNSSV